MKKSVERRWLMRDDVWWMKKSVERICVMREDDWWEMMCDEFEEECCGVIRLKIKSKPKSFKLQKREFALHFHYNVLFIQVCPCYKQNREPLFLSVIQQNKRHWHNDHITKTQETVTQQNKRQHDNAPTSFTLHSLPWHNRTKTSVTEPVCNLFFPVTLENKEMQSLASLFTCYLKQIK